MFTLCEHNMKLNEQRSKEKGEMRKAKSHDENLGRSLYKQKNIYWSNLKDRHTCLTEW